MSVGMCLDLLDDFAGFDSKDKSPDVVLSPNCELGVESFRLGDKMPPLKDDDVVVAFMLSFFLVSGELSFSLRSSTTADSSWIKDMSF
eukprot:CAMPEP_0195253340 /NCGR_PEP_ID=MMETSP0706-20130129/4400_1 /TAXON_ID=33640 /ORGANISM="Asterionellopsis glacialis, Strain CCMP134" /LENGTH=87 /DNA_ID=CAMNT_0040305809 /DNA_START=321 /DNA_END=584 /DNA_ORIENTATION=-